MGTSGNDIGLLAQVREDLARHEGALSAPGFHAIAVYRLGRYARTQHGLRAFLLRRVHRACYVLVRNFYGIELPADAVIGRRLLLHHQHGVIVNAKAVIGDDCVFANNVTIGVGVPGKNSVPRIGNRVTIAPGVIVVGQIAVGDDVVIGPNAVVMSDVPAGARVVAPPGRVLQLQTPAPVAN